MINFKQKINPDLKVYIERNIIPQYKNFDQAHNESHVKEVISAALQLAQHYSQVSSDQVFTAAAYHDIGLRGSRDTHHLLSGKLIRQDLNLLKWFTKDEIEEIAKAAEDHRSSNGQEPRSLLGKIISEADRVIDCQRTLERTLSFGISNYPESTKEEQIQRAMDYITKKYGPYGRIKIWIPESPNKRNLEELQKLIRNRKEFYNKLSEIYDELQTETSSSLSTRKR